MNTFCWSKASGKALLLAVFLVFFLDSQIISADSPELKTPAPVIYLSNNLDEKDNLGWCIDTVGRGFSERLHAHSCKPRGGDVQFYYKNETKQIVSATFAGKCATLDRAAAEGVSLGLLDCMTDSNLQSFVYSLKTSEFRPENDQSICLVVGRKSRSAGPFMSRDLTLASCDKTEARFKQWKIKTE